LSSNFESRTSTFPAEFFSNEAVSGGATVMLQADLSIIHSLSTTPQTPSRNLGKLEDDERIEQ
jgi:hypothetical protein